MALTPSIVWTLVEKRTDRRTDSPVRLRTNTSCARALFGRRVKIPAAAAVTIALVKFKGVHFGPGFVQHLLEQLHSLTSARAQHYSAAAMKVLSKHKLVITSDIILCWPRVKSAERAEF